MKKIILILGLMLIAIVASACTTTDTVPESQIPTSFEECVDQTGTVAESYPRQCFFDNLTFVEELEEEIQEPKMCTKEYNPQCGIDGVTYGNPCMAEGVEIVHSGECKSETQLSCEENGGNWLSNYAECEGISQETCESLNGEFQECASACRHNQDPERICTLQCVLVCQFT